MKNRRRLFIFLAVLTCFISATARNISAASTGTYTVETFEAYKTSKAINAFWRPSKAVTLAVDTTQSAPNRGDGKSLGNYRSMKVEFDTSKNENWVSFSNYTVENPYPLKDMAAKNGNGTMNFWAKGSKPFKLRAWINIKDIPFGLTVDIGTSWKEYRLDFRKLKPYKGSESLPDFITCVQNGKFNEAFMCGYKFEVIGADQDSGKAAGTLWLDSLTVSGDHVVETTTLWNGDPTEFNRLGSVPADFNPATTKTSVKTSGNNTGSLSTTANTGTSESTSATETTEIGSKNPPSAITDQTITNTQASKSEVLSERTTIKPTLEPKDVDNQNHSGYLGWVIAVAAVVVLGAGAVIYLIIFRRKKSN